MLAEYFSLPGRITTDLYEQKTTFILHDRIQQYIIPTLFLNGIGGIFQAPVIWMTYPLKIGKIGLLKST